MKLICFFLCQVSVVENSLISFTRSLDAKINTHIPTLKENMCNAIKKLHSFTARRWLFKCLCQGSWQWHVSLSCIFLGWCVPATTQKTMTSHQEVDVVVIGGGISGLTAAYRLLTKDPQLLVTVLEAKGRYIFFCFIVWFILIYLRSIAKQVIPTYINHFRLLIPDGIHLMFLTKWERKEKPDLSLYTEH